MAQPSLFDSERDQAVRDMIELFKRQLKGAATPLERAELKLAIRSWQAQLEPEAPMKPRRAKRHHKR